MCVPRTESRESFCRLACRGCLCASLFRAHTRQREGAKGTGLGTGSARCCCKRQTDRQAGKGVPPCEGGSASPGRGTREGVGFGRPHSYARGREKEAVASKVSPLSAHSHIVQRGPGGIPHTHTHTHNRPRAAQAPAGRAVAKGSEGGRARRAADWVLGVVMGEEEGASAVCAQEGERRRSG